MSADQNQNLPEIVTLLARPEVWLHYRTLAGQLSPALQIEALRAGGELLDALKTGTTIQTLPARWQAMLAVAINHVSYQAPLLFSDQLAAAFDQSDGGMTAYCPRDGYRVPLSISRCPACNAAVVAGDTPPPLNINKALEDAVKAVAADATFWRALDQLAAKLGPDRNAALARWAGVVLRTGEVSLPQGVMPTVPVMIAFLHVATGTPVHITDRLMDAWQRWDKSEDVAECSGCGYRHPPKYPLCVLCGSETAVPGTWARLRLSQVLPA
jgi:hypothetical protein